MKDFSASGPNDAHFVLDETAGTLYFGNGINGRIVAATSSIGVDTRSAKVFAAISPPPFPGPSRASPDRSEPMSCQLRTGRTLGAFRICDGSHGGDQERAARGDVSDLDPLRLPLPTLG